MEPMVISMEYACVKDKTSMAISASEVSVRLSFSLIRLLLRVHNNVISTFQFGGGRMLCKCSHFERIWVNTGIIHVTMFSLFFARDSFR